MARHRRGTRPHRRSLRGGPGHWPARAAALRRHAGRGRCRRLPWRPCTTPLALVSNQRAGALQGRVSGLRRPSAGAGVPATRARQPTRRRRRPQELKHTRYVCVCGCGVVGVRAHGSGARAAHGRGRAGQGRAGRGCPAGRLCSGVQGWSRMRGWVAWWCRHQRGLPCSSWDVHGRAVCKGSGACVRVWGKGSAGGRGRRLDARAGGARLTRHAPPLASFNPRRRRLRSKRPWRGSSWLRATGGARS